MGRGGTCFGWEDVWDNRGMQTRSNRLEGLLTAIMVVLAIALVAAQAIFTMGSQTVKRTEEDIEEVNSEIEKAELESDSLTTELESDVVSWRVAEGRIANKGDGAGLVCYLTFSGGPSSQTKKNLEVLEEAGAVATWFCYADESSVEGLDLSLVADIEEQGSAVGILGYSQSEIYESYWGTVEDYLEDDFLPAKEALEEATGHEIDICRFPGGSTMIAYYNTSLADALPVRILKEGYQYFDWNVSGGDSDSEYYNESGVTPTDTILDNVVSEAQQFAKRDSSICVMLTDAEGKTTTTKALQAIVAALSEMGYEFETLDNSSAGYYERDIEDSDSGDSDSEESESGDSGDSGDGDSGDGDEG